MWRVFTGPLWVNGCVVLLVGRADGTVDRAAVGLVRARVTRAWLPAILLRFLAEVLGCGVTHGASFVGTAHIRRIFMYRWMSGIERMPM
jgi:hypothetical protein